jgi:uncharacterized protein
MAHRALRFPFLVLLGCLPLAGGSPPRPLEYFRPADVSLLEGPFLHAQNVLRDHLLEHDVDRFLAPFRAEAGLEPKAPRYPNWESQGLAGHSAGHYLTALAQLSAATGDPEVTRRLEYMVAELAEIQQAHGNGYVGGVPRGRAMWDQIAQGKISAESFGLNDGWVPWYNLHKTFAGLRNAWHYAGNEQARDMFLKLCDWCDELVAGLSDEQVEIMLRTEHGGMAEALADAYAISGEQRYLALARRFSHRAILNPLLEQEDQLTGLHANTQIPKATGFARIGELGRNPHWIKAADFFWHTVVNGRSVAIGGNSVREHFHARDDFTPMIESREGPETCNTYNMLRLTEQLFRGNPSAEYADYYERAVFNHILSTQHPEHGGFVYFTPMRPRDYRVYSRAELAFWCCVGTGMENHGRYNRFVYSHRGDELWVNLFLATELRWPEQGLVLRQQTTFPDTPKTRLELSLAQPRRLTLQIRRPSWAGDGFAIHINGRPHRATGEPASYVALEREWRDGDTVEITLPMRTNLEPLPDGSPYVAVLHGPIVLAARTGQERLDGLIAGDGRMAHIGPGPLLPLDGAPMLIGETNEVLAALKPVAGSPLTFVAPEVIQPARYRDLRLEPFFRVHDSRYVIYWRQTTPQAYPQLVAEMEAREQARLALEERTLDQVIPGEQQPEVEHRYAGDNATTGVTLGRSWRSARGWFEYQLQGAPEQPMELWVTYWEGEWGRREFDILVNNQLLARVTREPGASDRFTDVAYPIPSDMVPADGIMRVRFVARADSTAGAVYGVRLVRQ